MSGCSECPIINTPIKNSGFSKATTLDKTLKATRVIMNVLIVDDSRIIQATITEAIKGLGHDVVTAKNGAEALSAIYQHDIDLILMDVEMPGLNGFETTKALRAFLHNQWVPIVFLSSQNEDEYIVEGLDAGGDVYITKPVNFRVLEAMVSAMGRIVVIQDELNKTNALLEEQANIDMLTQLVNRRGFDDALKKETRRCQRKQQPLSVILIDIDYFKPYNDNYGHLQGDSVLSQVGAALININIRPGDVAARYGGEEFVMLLPETNEQGAITMANRIQNTISELNVAHEHSKVSKQLTISQGIATVYEYDSDANVVESADQALYQAKESGRNQWKLYGAH